MTEAAKQADTDPPTLPKGPFQVQKAVGEVLQGTTVLLPARVYGMVQHGKPMLRVNLQGPTGWLSILVDPADAYVASPAPVQAQTPATPAIPTPPVTHHPV